jgi:hypothetical protein
LPEVWLREPECRSEKLEVRSEQGRQECLAHQVCPEP